MSRAYRPAIERYWARQYTAIKLSLRRPTFARARPLSNRATAHSSKLHHTPISIRHRVTGMGSWSSSSSSPIHQRGGGGGGGGGVLLMPLSTAAAADDDDAQPPQCPTPSYLLPLDSTSFSSYFAAAARFSYLSTIRPKIEDEPAPAPAPASPSSAPLLPSLVLQHLRRSVQL